MNRRTIAILVSAACLLTVGYREGAFDRFLQPDAPTVVVDDSEVAKAKAVVGDPADARLLGSYLLGAADVLERDVEKRIQTGRDLSRFLNDLGAFFTYQKPGRYPGLAAYMAERLSVKNQGQLTDAERADVVRRLRDTGHAFSQVK